MANRRSPRSLLRHNSSSTSCAITDCCEAAGLLCSETAVEGYACGFEGRGFAEAREHGEKVWDVVFCLCSSLQLALAFQMELVGVSRVGHGRGWAGMGGGRAVYLEM